MFIRDIDKKPDVVLLVDSQDVKPLLADLNCDEDYEGIFLFEGNAYGFKGNVPYLSKELFLIGPYER